MSAGVEGRLTAERLAEWEQAIARLKLPPLEVMDDEEGEITAGGASIASVYMADDFPCLDETELEAADGEMRAIRDMIVTAVNHFPELIAEVRALRAVLTASTAEAP